MRSTLINLNYVYEQIVNLQIDISFNPFKLDFVQ